MAAETAQVRDAQLFSSMCYRKLLFRAVTYTHQKWGNHIFLTFRLINSNPMQKLFLCLLLLDVVIIFTELGECCGT